MMRVRSVAHVLGLAFGLLAANTTVSCVTPTSGEGGSGGQTTTSEGGTTTTTTTTTPSAGGGGSGGQGGGISGCQDDAMCPNAVCNEATGECLPCMPEKDICPQGQYCTSGFKCEVGCTEQADCNDMTLCDTDKHTCVGCLTDSNCPQGSICNNTICVPGCSGSQPCQVGYSCCGTQCFNLSDDEENCGFCNNSCVAPPNAGALCDEGLCTMGTCKPAYADCNLDPTDGCEHNFLVDGPCSCIPGETQPCYTGEPGTINVGQCKGGTRTCLDGVSWSACAGQVLPTYEHCNMLDDDCDGTIEPQPCVDCIPNTGTCIGNVAHGCNDDALGYTDEVCDPLQGTTCNPMTGKCDGACGLAALGDSYIGCDYWPTITANIVATNFHFSVAVSNTAATTANLTVTKGTTTIATATVAPNSVQIINLPWDLTLKGPTSNAAVPFPSSVKVTQGAFRLRSDQPVTVYQFNPLEYTLAGSFSYTNDASILLPVNVWTGKYRVAARHMFFGMSGFYAVTAREDNTTVTVTPGPASGVVKVGIPGLNMNGTGTFVLNAGDVAEVVTGGGASVPNDPNDVTGTLVTANKNIQVIGGHQCIFIPYSTGYCDHIEETMFPEETLSTTYLVTAPLIPTGGAIPKVQRVRIVATQPNTMLTYEPPQAGAPGMITNAGEWVELADSTNDYRITGSQPILVVQYMEGQDAGGASGDPAMSILVGQEQYRKSYLFHAPTNYEYSYANIVAPTGKTVAIDGINILAAEFVPIGATGYSVARVTLSNAGNGNHTASGSEAFGISVYGYGQYTSYWYPGGSNIIKLHK